MIVKDFKVSGMCCPNCVTHIQSALQKVGEFNEINVQVENSHVSLNLMQDIENEHKKRGFLKTLLILEILFLHLLLFFNKLFYKQRHTF